MTHTTEQGPSADAAEASESGATLSALVNRIAVALDKALPAGDVAALRRLSPDDPGSPGFWKIVVSYLEPAGALPDGGSSREEVEVRWAAILNVLARLGPLHRPGRRLGRALAACGFSELRLARLLRASGEPLVHESLMAGRFLAAKGEPADVTDLARLILSDGRSDADRVRRWIARDYYSLLITSSKEGD